MIRGLVSATYAPSTLVGVRRLPCARPPGANRDGTMGRLPTAMISSSYGCGTDTANASEVSGVIAPSGLSSIGAGATVAFPVGAGRLGDVPTTIQPTREVDTDVADDVAADRPWVVIVWNDPVNLMSYVTFVFQKLFGFSLEKATELMMDVHEKGKAVVAQATREEAEMHVYRLHEHSLWATMEHDR